MDVKSNVLPKSLQGPSPAPKPQPKRDSDEKKLSTDVSPAPQASLPDDLRKALIGELLNAETEVNRFYQGTLNAWTDANTSTFAGGATTLSAVPQGTGAGQRLGDSIRYKRLRFRIHLRPGQLVDPATTSGPSAGQPSDVEHSYAMRVVIGIDKMPVIGVPVYVDTGSYDIGGTFPFSPSATHANPRGDFTGTPSVYPGMMHLTVRNPQTITRYHLLYDRIHNKSDKYEQYTEIIASGSPATAASFYMRTSSEWLELEFDLRGHISQWYDQSNDNAILTNKLFFMVLCDAPSAGSGKYKWMSELEFENAA